MRHVTRRTFTLTTIAITISLLGIAGPARAQSGSGVLVGAVHDSANAAISGARVDLVGSAVVGVVTSPHGSFRLVNIPAGPRTVVVHRLGFAPDSARVEIAAGGTTVHNFVLAPAAVNLASVVVRASPRMAETKAGALAVEQNAPNIVSALSGDEIRSLPNFNAAEAAGRIPGISLERDEGEGKFVQVRGTEPRLSNVTINGVHVPGTEASRIAKLDDVPSDLLASIEVSKTLTADMEADAIGGSVRLVTKTPEDAPRGYVAGQYGQTAHAGGSNVGRHGGGKTHRRRLDARLRAGRGGHEAAEPGLPLLQLRLHGTGAHDRVRGPGGNRLSQDSLPESRRLTSGLRPGQLHAGCFLPGGPHGVRPGYRWRRQRASRLRPRRLREQAPVRRPLSQRAQGVHLRVGFFHRHRRRRPGDHPVSDVLLGSGLLYLALERIPARAGAGCRRGDRVRERALRRLSQRHQRRERLRSEE